MTKVAVFVGSLREKSSNKVLAHSLEKVAPEGMEFEYIDIRLPLYSEDIENAGIPDEVRTLKGIVESVDGVLFATPEYNRSVPGVLKNAIDWISRPYGQSSFAGKPVGIVGSSMGPVGTALAQADLRRIMLFQNARVLGQPEVYVANAYEAFDEEGKVSERWEKNFKEYMTAFAAWIEK
ncbi:MAG TPA: NAD(P)H-dependent oxidoreductase [Candidatus Saccharimonadales bacterium]|nr:NAD(P)H-dependent oxidoreductase [Candidatus Saccharimonadales bacterium]